MRCSPDPAERADRVGTSGGARKLKPEESKLAEARQAPMEAGSPIGRQL